MIAIDKLMIGDWVSINGKPCKVAVLRRGNEYELPIGVESKYGVVYCSEEHVEPIMLTPEILEKNGWKIHATYGLKEEDGFVERVYMLYKYSYEVVFEDNNPVTIRRFKQVDDDGYDMLYIANEMFVHVLQNSFRLFCLNELANNFKV